MAWRCYPRRPHGFEGLAGVQVGAHSPQLALPEPVRQTDLVLDRDAAALRRAGLSMGALESTGQAVHESPGALEQPAVLLVNGSVEVFPGATSAAGALDRPGLSFVYSTRDALAHVGATLAKTWTELQFIPSYGRLVFGAMLAIVD